MKNKILMAIIRKLLRVAVNLARKNKASEEQIHEFCIRAIGRHDMRRGVCRVCGVTEPELAA